MSKKNGKAPKTHSVEVLFCPESGELNVNGPDSLLATMDMLQKAQGVVLRKMAERELKAAVAAKNIQVAGAHTLRHLGGGKPG